MNLKLGNGQAAKRVAGEQRGIQGITIQDAVSSTMHTIKEGAILLRDRRVHGEGGEDEVGIYGSLKDCLEYP